MALHTSCTPCPLVTLHTMPVLGGACDGVAMPTSSSCNGRGEAGIAITRCELRVGPTQHRAVQGGKGETYLRCSCLSTEIGLGVRGDLPARAQGMKAAPESMRSDGRQHREVAGAILDHRGAVLDHRGAVLVRDSSSVGFLLQDQPLGEEE